MSKIRKELISPARAEKLLEKNVVNRILRDWWIESLSQLMTREEFYLSAAPICIGMNGELYNGQHRLWAVVRSGKAQWFWVMYDCDASILETIDSNIPRTLNDRVNIIQGRAGEEKMGPKYMAAVKAYYALPYNKKHVYWSTQRFIDAERKAHKYVSFAFNLLKPPIEAQRVACSSAIAAVARARAAGVTDDVLTGFCITLCSSAPSNIRERVQDNYVRKIRDKLISRQVGPIGWDGQSEYYLYIAKAIKCFDTSEIPSKVYLPSSDPFPLKRSFAELFEEYSFDKPKESCRKLQKKMLQAMVDESDNKVSGHAIAEEKVMMAKAVSA